MEKCETEIEWSDQNTRHVQIDVPYVALAGSMTDSLGRFDTITPQGIEFTDVEPPVRQLWVAKTQSDVKVDSLLARSQVGMCGFAGRTKRLSEPLGAMGPE